MIKLSILIPMYNASKCIGNCLDSIINQNLSKDEYEIIVMNDGSTDDSASIVKEYTKIYTNIFLYTHENCGLGATRNKSLKLAKGDYIYFLDSDDYLANNVLSKITQNATAYNLDIVTFNSKKTEHYKLHESTTNNNRTFNLNITTGVDYMTEICFKNEVWWYIIKREFLINTGIVFIEGRWLEDGIFTASLFLEAKTMSNIPIDAHRYVKAVGSAMTSKKTSHYIKIIYDMENAAKLYTQIIEFAKVKYNSNINLIDRLKARQQSYVFFMMIRMIKSAIKFKEVKAVLKRMEKLEAYPLNSFLGKDYKKISYIIMVKLFNNVLVFYLIFIILNPIFGLKSKLVSLSQD